MYHVFVAKVNIVACNMYLWLRCVSAWTLVSCRNSRLNSKGNHSPQGIGRCQCELTIYYLIPLDTTTIEVMCCMFMLYLLPW